MSIVGVCGDHADGAGGGVVEEVLLVGGDSLDLVVADLHISDGHVLGQLGHMDVGVGVIHHLVASVVKDLD